jgi:outer membrane protein assembly factor BamB
VAGSSVFIPLSDEEFRGRSGVLCLAADTGRRNWLSPTEHSIRGGLAMAGRLLVLVTQAGEVLALNRDTGKTVWSRKLKEFPHRWIHSTAVIVAGTVIAGNGEGGIEGLDLRTGEPLWHWTHLEGQLDRPHFVRPTPLGNDVAIPVRGIGVSCLSALTGQPRWHFNARYDPMLPSPLLAGRRLLVPEGRDKIHAVDPEDGRRLWTRRTPGHEVVGWACNSEVLVLNTFHRSRPGTAQCRRVTNGNLLWNVEYRKDLADMLEYSCGGSQALAAPLLTGQMVYLAGLDGRLCMVDRKTGTCSGRLDLGEPIVSTASLNEHALLTVTYPGRITRIDTPHLSPTPR